jgi:hypothetical protein
MLRGWGADETAPFGENVDAFGLVRSLLLDLPVSDPIAP